MKWKFYAIFHVSLLKQDNIKKTQVSELLELNLEPNKGEQKEYKVEAIKDNAI